MYVPPGALIKGEACVGCHDSQLFIRTPHTQQAKYSSRLADRVNAWSDADALHGRLTHVGLPFQAWNEDKNQPKRVRIDVSKYDARFPLKSDEAADFAAGKLAPANACTTCHSVGKSPLKPPHADEGSCDNFVREWVDPTYHGPVTKKFLSETAKSWPNSHWMPPGDTARFKTRDEYEKYYRRALLAIKRCCINPDLEGQDNSKPCLEGWANVLPRMSGRALP